MEAFGAQSSFVDITIINELYVMLLHEFCRQMLTSVTFFIRLLESVLSVSVEKITTVSGLISLINDLGSIRLFVTSSAVWSLTSLLPQ